MHIRESAADDLPSMLAIINGAAEAYRRAIPPDCWHEPYMPAAELEGEIAAGVRFWVAEAVPGRIEGLMGIQDRGDVTLVRHAYVAPVAQRGGVGTMLLRHLHGLADKPVLIGTWADATWAIAFYRKNGFALASHDEKERLLRKYWSIPPRQVETSVVLGDARWQSRREHPGAPILAP
ncbi:MAG TPA: GNAT family N-acetyltransferase [Usitatibacter sp.]|jgi:GNAT superfamily N-acetyltransferase|nr:GNAT family N-acetyltransferase [Usitatibacter sp.]